MNSQQYILSHYIKNLKNTEDVNKHLYQTHNIMTKDFPDLDMTIYYNKYSNKHKSAVELASRSVIMSRGDNKKVICYTCPTPLYNHEATSYLNRHKDKINSSKSYMCYEGSLMSVFNYNNVWYLSSRRNVYNSSSNKEQEDNKDNKDNKETNNQFKMFARKLN
jgi:RNase P subunit RPR2